MLASLLACARGDVLRLRPAAGVPRRSAPGGLAAPGGRGWRGALSLRAMVRGAPGPVLPHARSAWDCRSPHGSPTLRGEPAGPRPTSAGGRSSGRRARDCDRRVRRGSALRRARERAREAGFSPCRLRRGEPRSSSRRGPRPRIKRPRKRSPIGDGPAAYMVDLASGRRTAFFAPEVESAQWNRTGTRMALVDNARPLGAIGPARLRFVDARGQELWPPFLEPERLSLLQLEWDRGSCRRSLSRRGAADHGAGHLRSGQPPAGDGREDPPPAWSTLHTAVDGRVFLFTSHVGLGKKDAAPRPVRSKGPGLSVHSISSKRSSVPPVLQGHGLTHGGLSPHGRYWMQRSRGKSAVIELASGAVHPLPVNPSWLAWTADDDLVWLESQGAGWTLFRMAPGGAPFVWANGPEVSPLLKISPDGAFVAVTVLGPEAARIHACCSSRREATGLRAHSRTSLPSLRTRSSGRGHTPWRSPAVGGSPSTTFPQARARWCSDALDR
jgi:hypothetical protein